MPAAPRPGGWLRFQIEVPDIEATVAKLKAAAATLPSEVMNGHSGKQILQTLGLDRQFQLATLALRASRSFS